jgi:hypothetical protein
MIPVICLVCKEPMQRIGADEYTCENPVCGPNEDSADFREVVKRVGNIRYPENF